MAVAVSEHGYEGTTVADIVRIAHASRRTFYLTTSRTAPSASWPSATG